MPESISNIKAEGLKDPLLSPEVAFKNWVCSRELLRHFRSSYPVTTQSLVNKVRRLKDAISQRDTKLEEIKLSAQSDLRHQVSLVVHPMHQALEAALVHYDADDKKRNAKGPKANGYV
ncbi:hypothetical protein L195_g043845 [Trifolium pratense]|uniref:Uncharacterized protein n=1 Tax=Trifolium pratense TaxID=57577 RepID=A0A2K3MAD6_TRIPR|nr:hypothetical protein L195_g043845 [Trifolium pratense]